MLDILTTEAKKEDYSREELLDVLESYLIRIERDGERFPNCVISDLRGSIKFVLKKNRRC